MRKKRPNPLLKDIAITGVASEGKAFGKYNDIVVFVPFAAPGDVADIQIVKKRRRYMEGRIAGLKVPSASRTDPFCKHFGVCGGCKWQHLPYDQQLQFKQQQVLDHFVRIGKIDIPEPEPILASQNTRFYRNKLEYTFTSHRWLTDEEIASGEDISEFRAAGFHIPGRFDKVLDIEECFLQAEPSNSIRLAIRDYAIRNGLDFFDLRKQVGFLRTCVIRTTSTGEVMVIVVFFQEDRIIREKLLDWLGKQFPDITSLMYVINPKANDTISDLEIELFKGRDHIFEEMDGLRFRVGPKSFYQTNSQQAGELYGIILDYANPRDDETIYDLYTGTGTIASYIARHCRKVAGFEHIPEAIDDAKINAGLNGIDNLDFYAGDIKDMLTSVFISQYGSPHTIITDPPRTGMHQSVIERILEAKPERIVYVSCNSATQARDIAMLDGHYMVGRMRAVDMFPHTHHIENVVLLTRR